MPRKKTEKTSSKAGAAAARVLAGKGTKADARTAAASALTQRPNRRKAKKKVAKKKGRGRK